MQSLTLPELISLATGMSDATAYQLLQDKSLQDLLNIPLSILEITPTNEGGRLGETRAARLLASLELSNRMLINRQPKQKLSGPSEIYKHFNYLLSKPQEHLVVLGMDNQNIIQCEFEVSIGNREFTMFACADLFRPLVKYDSVRRFVMIHNHPFGEAKPSPQDIEFTNKAVESSKQLDLLLIDHVIISASGFFSFLQQKLLGEKT